MIKTLAISILPFFKHKIYCFAIIVYLASISISILNAQNTDSKIEGTLKLDSIWNPKVYLSHISDFSKMYTMSKSMIIAESEVDIFGNFKFNIHFLPKEDNLFRIHISKKGTSKVSLIIGGKNENHFFLVANNTSSVKILSKSGIFNDVQFLSDSKNKIIEKIDTVVRYIDSTNFDATRVKSQFVTNAFNEQLRQIADSCSYPLVSLYALQKSNFETNITDNTGYYQNLTKRWKSENSIYFTNFKSKIPIQKNKIDSHLLIISGFIIAFLLGFILNKIIKRNTPKASEIIKSLSLQERKIYVLLKASKSNKEISDELNIGISTVKSHVSSIYSKLNVKSRKDIVNL
ncbi:response regulator transcription factor [Winogradskyella sp. UBA3174]|uniref:response regulator transcription factor n=1 Tax=Winogradskyella sp. UBA3174 TaxID=1947785 RepID=UPI0025F665B6|nr:helix-turn-helix transcriptional regulator [Winogradskyella sp. UBA3174]|tara:strand:+ start:5148 stop:6185 length:1038 start_codon:yes stop_codon:yes gene_type:complete